MKKILLLIIFLMVTGCASVIENEHGTLVKPEDVPNSHVFNHLDGDWYKCGDNCYHFVPSERIYDEVEYR